MSEDYLVDTTDDDDEDLAAEATVLEGLKAIISQEVQRDHVQIDVPDREGVAVVFNPNFRLRQLNAWYKKAGEGTRKGFDAILLATIVIAKTVDAIKFNGVVARENGVKLNFVSPTILAMVDRDRPVPDGIIAFWGSDAHLQATASKIIEAAGFIEDVDAVDPTTGL